jgi:hypothetical protein
MKTLNKLIVLRESFDELPICHARRNVMPVNHGITSSIRRGHAPMARPLGPLKGDELACWQFTGLNRSETVEC